MSLPVQFHPSGNDDSGGGAGCLSAGMEAHGPARGAGAHSSAAQAGMGTERVLEPVYHGVYHGLRELPLVNARTISGQRKSLLI